MKRHHLTLADAWRTAWRGISSRTQRSALAALGIAVGVAALVALTGIAESNRLGMLAELDDMGANLLVAEGGRGSDGKAVTLPASAVDSIRRQDNVVSVGAFENVPEGLHAYRNDMMPPGETGGIAVLAATPELLQTVGAEMQTGRWFDSSTRNLPGVVLGSEAAKRLGVTQAGDRVYIGNEWYGVMGILKPVELATQFNTAAILGDQWVRNHYPPGPLDESPKVGDIASIYVQAAPGTADSVRSILASAASPGSPFVAISALSDLADARGLADTMLSTLGMALGGIALLVGGVGIANTMVVTVMERRGEIGLRRALGARPTQITVQFLSEATVLSLLGGVVGVGLGLAVSLVGSTVLLQPFAVPWSVMAIGLGVSVVVGALAGLQPAMKASRLTPNTALRAV